MRRQLSSQLFVVFLFFPLTRRPASLSLTPCCTFRDDATRAKFLVHLATVEPQPQLSGLEEVSLSPTGEESCILRHQPQIQSFIELTGRSFLNASSPLSQEAVVTHCCVCLHDLVLEARFNERGYAHAVRTGHHYFLRCACREASKSTFPRHSRQAPLPSCISACTIRQAFCWLSWYVLCQFDASINPFTT